MHYNLLTLIAYYLLFFIVAALSATFFLLVTGVGFIFLLCGLIYGLLLKRYANKRIILYSTLGIIIITVLGSLSTPFLFGQPLWFLRIPVSSENVSYIFEGGLYYGIAVCIFAVLGLFLGLALGKRMIKYKKGKTQQIEESPTNSSYS